MRSLFGVPVLQSKSPAVTGAVDYIYRTNHAWVVSRELDGAVVAWSITVTDPKFKIDLQELTFGLVGGRLGHTTFDQAVESPDGQYEEQGAAAYTYAESRYFGRPSGYQSFVFSYNREGIGKCKPSGQFHFASPPFVSGDPVGDIGQLEDTRRQTTLNTFYSTGRNDEALAQGSGFWSVVHADFVAPLRGAPTERKKWLKKRRKALKASQKA